MKRQKKGNNKLRVRESASEMLCLTRYLNLIIGDLVAQKNKYWRLYRCLRNICAIVTAPQLREGEIFELGELIQKHNELYKKLFEKLKPKMHIITHYVRIIRLFGPVIHFSTIMFERKNKKLKEIPVGTTCSLHLLTTIAMRHQLQLCYSNEFNPVTENEVLLGPIKNKDVFMTLKLSLPFLPNDSIVVTLQYIEILGKKYKEGTIIIVNSQDLPQFAVIKTLYLVNDTLFIQVHNFKVYDFDPHYLAYPVTYSNTDDYLIHDFLKFPPCLHITINDKDFIATRHIL